MRQVDPKFERALDSIIVTSMSVERNLSRNLLDDELQLIKNKCGVMIDPSLKRLVCVTKPYNDVHLTSRKLFLTVAGKLTQCQLNRAKWSLSHSTGCVSLAYSLAHCVRSIGIDIEHENRCLDRRMARFYLNKQDQIFSEDLLNAWLVKEAALKCLDSFQSSLRMKDIVVNETEGFFFFCRS